MADAASVYQAEAVAAGRECLEAAVAYLGMGWPPLALCPPDHVGVGRGHAAECSNPGKVPWHSWKDYQSVLPAAGLVRGWWKQNVQSNVGVALGPLSGLIGVDPDGPAGEAKLQEMSAGDLPPTLEFSTPGGGRRLLYRIPSGSQFRPTYLNIGKHEELRFLALGAQTVMPPSRHKSGGRYVWKSGQGPGEIEAAPAPKWLVAYMTERPARTGAVPAEGELVLEGGRDSYLTSLAGSLRGRGLSAAVIEATLLAENAERCDPPLADSQVRKIARSVGRYEAGSPEIQFTRAAAASKNGAHGAKAPADLLAERWRFTWDDADLAEGTPEELTAAAVKVAQSGPRQFPIYTLPVLLTKDFPAPNWVIPGLLSEGLNILAGSPKTGKSMLALNLAMTVAGGGLALGEIVTRAGDVLYLALEDTARRVRDRARLILGAHGSNVTRRFTLATRWPGQDRGGLQVLDLWVKRVERPTLVVIDVWGKFRPEVKASGSQYEQDYRHLSGVKEYLDERHCNSLVLMHTRKAPSEDEMHMISGTQGLGGVADGVLVLNRARGQNEAKVFLTGRDVAETDLALQFDPDTLTWRSMGSFSGREESKVKAAILAVYQASPGGSYWPSEMARLTAADKTGDAAKAWAAVVKTTMWRMEQDGILKRVGAKYGWPVDEMTQKETPL
jgi:hypothetical protein